LKFHAGTASLNLRDFVRSARRKNYPRTAQPVRSVKRAEAGAASDEAAPNTRSGITFVASRDQQLLIDAGIKSLRM